MGESATIEGFIVESMEKAAWEQKHILGTQEGLFSKREIEITTDLCGSIAIKEFSDMPNKYCISSDCGHLGINNSMDEIIDFIIG